MEVNEFDKCEKLVGKSVRVTTTENDELCGGLTTIQVNDKTAELRIILKIDNGLMTIPFRSIQKIEEV